MPPLLELRSRLVILAGGMIAALLLVSPAWGGVPLYPDLETLPPRDLRLDRTDVSPDSSTVLHNVLRFSNTTWNNGEGRAEIRAQIDPTSQEGPAVERVYDTDGNFAEYPVGRIYYHAAHDHYHYDNWGEYQLWTRSNYDTWIASGRSLGAAYKIGTKTTSCVMDVELVKTLPATPYPRTFPGTGCGSPNAQGVIVEGLSVGWGDLYPSSRVEQWIDLDQETLPDGDYVLRSVADPDNHVYESAAKADAARESQPDNEAVTAFSISGGQLVDSNPPDAPTVTANHVDEETTSPTVTVAVMGRDDVSGIDQLRLSNDGNQWRTYPYTTDGEENPTEVQWDLTDPATGGTDAGGTHTVYAQVHDRAGRWSTTGTDTIVLHNGATASYSSAVQADTPAGYWRLGETSGTTAADSAGASPGTYRNGVVLNVPSLLTSDTANGAATFDGVNDHVSIADKPALNPTSQLSLEAWIKPATIPSTGSFASVATKDGSFSIQFNGPRLEFTLIQSGTRRRVQAPAGAIVAGQRYHVVGTYDGATAHLYVNGSPVATLPVSGPVTITSAPLTIAAWSATEEFMKGTIDEVALYSRPLTGARVQAHYVSGTSAAPSPVVAPSNLTATAAASRIDLHWTDNSSNETAFVVERDTDSGFSAPTTVTLGQNTTSYADTGLLAGRKYYYRVRARNATDTSGWSNVASATTPDPVAAPSGLTATATSETRVNLSWLDNSTNETQFVLERSTSSTFSSPTTATLAANTTTYVDLGVVAGTSYWYRVRARNDSDTSPNSNPATVTTPSPPAGPYADTVRADNPTAHWRLGETSGTVAGDAVSAFPGTYVNGPTLGSTSLLGLDTGNRAVAFDGTNDHVRVPDATALRLTSPFTLEAWIRPAAVPANSAFASILTKENSYSLQFNGPKLEFTIIQSNARKRLQAPSGAVVAGQRYHVVATYDGTTRRLYLNGAQVATGALSGGATSTANPVTLASWGGTEEFYRGTLDEIAVYRSALSAARVTAHWNAGR